MGFGGRVEVQPAFLDQLQRGRRGDRLGGREQREDAVGRHRRVAVKPALACSTLVEVALPVRRHRDDAGHPRLAADDAVQHGRPPP